MKDFIRLVLSQNRNFKNLSLNYSDIDKVEQIVISALNLNNVKDLRDRFEGLDFFNKFSLKVFGVIALEKTLKTKFINWDKINPKDYKATININGKTIIVITCNYGDFPLIDKAYKKPIIFCFKRDKKDIWICGVATKDILDNNQNDSLVKGTVTRNLTNKTTFVGFDKLKMFHDLKELEKIISI